MGRLIVPNKSPIALALREPNLLAPNKRPTGQVKVKKEWLNRGLISAWFFGGGTCFDVVSGKGPTLLNNVDSGPDYLQTKGIVTSYIDIDVQLSGDTVTPYSYVVDAEHISGTVNWSFLNSSSLWTGIYGESGTTIKTTNSNSFDGLISPSSGGSNNSCIAVSHSANNLRGSRSGGAIAQDTSAVAPASISRIAATIGGNRRAAGLENPSVTKIKLFISFSEILTDAELISLSTNPYQIFEPANDTPFVIGAAAAGVTGTGALAAQSSSISGTGEITHTGTGALASQASAIAGTGTVSGVVTGTGALAAQASQISGTGEITHTGTGALTSQSSAVSGTGTVTAAGVITGTGALASQVSQIAGAGSLERTAIGALIAQSSIVVGSGVIARTGTGALSSQVSQIAGVGSVTSTLTGSGSLVSAASVIAGTGTVTTPTVITGTGSLVCGSSSISGVEDIWIPINPVTTIWTEI